MKNEKLFVGIIKIPRIGLVKRKVQIREILPCLIEFPHSEKKFFYTNTFLLSRENAIFEIVNIYDKLMKQNEIA